MEYEVLLLFPYDQCTIRKQYLIRIFWKREKNFVFSLSIEEGYKKRNIPSIIGLTIRGSECFLNNCEDISLRLFIVDSQRLKLRYAYAAADDGRLYSNKLQREHRTETDTTHMKRLKGYEHA